MSTQVVLEADLLFTQDFARHVLRSIGVNEVEDFNGGFKALFPAGKVMAHYLLRHRAEVPFTDGMEHSTWRTNATLIFNVVWSEKLFCGRQLYEFVTALVEQTATYFVLSVQQERILSLRDESGIQHVTSEWERQFGEGAWGAKVH